MELRIGDRNTHEAGEWEVVSRPVSFRGGSQSEREVQVPDQPATVCGGGETTARLALWSFCLAGLSSHEPTAPNRRSIHRQS
jgi:hypothetical protein